MKLRVVLLLGTFLGGVAGAAAAQTAPKTTGGETTVGEIVVTGQKRASTVQNTAATINVITAETLAAKVQQLEHRLYPACVKLFCAGQVKLADNGALLNGQLLPLNGLDLTEA